MRNFVFLVLLALLSACGKEIIYVNQDGKPITPGECLPKAVADAGPNQHVAYDPDPSVVLPIPRYAQIGTQLPEGLTPQWSPAEGLDNPNVAQPIASPTQSTVYTLTVSSPKCGTVAKHATTVWVFTQKMAAEDMGVEIDGKWYPTGYSAIHKFLDHYRASYFHAGTGYYGLIKGLPKELDLTPPGFHVNRQPRGSCWAEGGRSCGEASYYYVTKDHVHISTQRLIDCSGFGSAAGGGQISIDDFVKHGLVRESDYPYDGYDHKCKKDIQGFYKAKNTFFLRGQDGGKYKWSDMKAAHFNFGASEDCGSAGAMGSGGWMKNPGNGGTNHCYGGFGWRVHSDGWECHIEQNSWGGDWGGGNGLSPGQGCYDIRASDGETIRSSIVTEIKFADFGSPCPPPKADAGPDKTILAMDGLPDFAIVGVKPTPEQLVNQTYSWSIVAGDMSAKIDSPTMAMTLVRPKKTTTLRLMVKNKCAEAHADVTIHVWTKDPVTGALSLVK